MRQTLRFVCVLAFLLRCVYAFPQQASNQGSAPQNLPDSPSVQTTSPKQTSDRPPAPDSEKQQPKRIAGLVPNYRTVSAGAVPPPASPRQAFTMATRSSFDYTSFVWVGVTAAISEGTDSHPQLGKGMPGFGRYYWRGWLDDTDGNYLVLAVMPTVFHQDERYFAKGAGGFWSRGTYAATRVFVARDYHGNDSFNVSEFLGRGASEAISLSYYPREDRTASKYARKYAFAVGEDALTNVFREFWPDIASRIFHKKP